MTENNPQEMRRWVPYTILNSLAQAAQAISSLQMEPPKEAEANQAVEDEKDRDDQIEKPRHDQDQKAGDDGDDRRDMGNGEGHKGSSAGRLGVDSRSVTLPSLATPCSTTADALHRNRFPATFKK
jgi:hypothetical protein